MSDFTEILRQQLQVKRFTANIVDKKVIVSSISPDRQPKANCRLAVEISEATAISSGLVSIEGTTVEELSFDANGVVVGVKDFDSVTGITVGGIIGGKIEIRAVTKTGQPINREYEVYASIPVRFYPMKAGTRMQVKMLPAGQQGAGEYKFMAEPNRDIRENDVVYAVSGIPGMTRGQVVFVNTLFDFEGVTHHIEAEVLKL